MKEFSKLHGARWTLFQNNRSTGNGTIPCFMHPYIQGSYLIRLLSNQSLWRSMRNNKVFPNNQSMLCDVNPAFTSSLMEAFSRQLNIKILTVSPTYHKSLLVEHGIQSLSCPLVKHLEQVWSWSSCLPYSMLCYNSYSFPNSDGFSPYELSFGHKMTINPDLEVQPDIVVNGTFRTFYEKLKKNLQYLCPRLQRFRSQRTDLLNRNKKCHAYQAGQIVYMYQAKGTILRT